MPIVVCGNAKWELIKFMTSVGCSSAIKIRVKLLDIVSGTHSVCLSVWTDKTAHGSSVWFPLPVFPFISFAPNKAQRRKPNFRLRGKNAKEERQKMDEYQEWISHLDCRYNSRRFQWPSEVLKTCCVNGEMCTCLLVHTHVQL